MICIYDPLDTVYRGHGLGILQPTSCVVREVAGGNYELSLVHPVTEDGKWERIVLGAVIRAPVPRVVTPALQMKAASAVNGLAVYRASFGENVIAQARFLSIRAKPDLHAAILESVPEGTEVIHTGETALDDEWLQFVTPSGTCGWAPHWYVEYVRPYVPEEQDGEVLEARQVREQLFRIYDVKQLDDGSLVSATARHVSYDGMYNPCQELNIEAPMPAATACANLLASLEDQEHNVRLFAAVQGTVKGDFSLMNGVNVLLDPSKGMAQQLRARVIRDNYDVFLLDNTSPDSCRVSIRYGKDLLGVGISLNDDGVYTRFVPLGKTKDGDSIRLPEDHIDSVNFAAYSYPRIRMWQVNGAQIGQKRKLEDGSEETLDEEGVYEMLREAVHEKLGKGEDEPAAQITVSFVELGQTQEYRDIAQLQIVNLYDWVLVVHGPRKLRLRKQVSGYQFDCLQGRYLALELGDVFASRQGTVI